MRWILPGLATFLLLAQEPLQVKKPTPEQLRQEITKLENDLKHLEKINRLKDVFDAAKRALAEELLPLGERKKLAKKRAREAKRKDVQPKKPPYRWVFMPNPMPAVLPMEARVLKDIKGIWWVIYRDKWHRLGMNEFGPNQHHRKDAEDWIKELRTTGYIK